MKQLVSILVFLVVVISSHSAWAIALSDGLSNPVQCTTSSCSVTPPSSTVSGHLLVFQLFIRSSASPTISTPSGLTLSGSITYSSTGGFAEATYYKIAGSSETSAYVFSFSGSATVYWANAGVVSLYDWPAGNSLSIYSANTAVTDVGCCGSDGPQSSDGTNANWESILAFYQNDSGSAYILDNNGSSMSLGWQQLNAVNNYSNLLSGLLLTVPSAGSTGTLSLDRTPNDGGTDSHWVFLDITGGSAPSPDYRVRQSAEGGNGSGSCGMTLPATATSGDLIVTTCGDSNPGTGETITCPSGFTQFSSDSTYLPTSTCYKISDGTEGTLYCGISPFGTDPLCST